MVAAGSIRLQEEGIGEFRAKTQSRKGQQERISDFFTLRSLRLCAKLLDHSTGRSRLVRALGSAYHLLARAWPEMFAYQIVLEAEITTLDEEATSPGPTTA